MKINSSSFDRDSVVCWSFTDHRKKFEEVVEQELNVTLTYGVAKYTDIYTTTINNIELRFELTKQSNLKIMAYHPGGKRKGMKTHFKGVDIATACDFLFARVCYVIKKQMLGAYLPQVYEA